MTADSAHVHASLLPIAVAMILYSQVGKVGSHVFVRVHVVLSPIKFAIGYLGGILFFPCSLAGGISLYFLSSPSSSIFFFLLRRQMRCTARVMWPCIWHKEDLLTLWISAIYADTASRAQHSSVLASTREVHSAIVTLRGAGARSPSSFCRWREPQ